MGKKKDALEKIAKSDELKGKAAEKAGEVADKKEEVAAAYEELGKQEQELVKLAQNAAEESQTASEEAAGAAEEALEPLAVDQEAARLARRGPEAAEAHHPAVEEDCRRRRRQWTREASACALPFAALRFWRSCSPPASPAPRRRSGSARGRGA